jgi:hypothetical protein
MIPSHYWHYMMEQGKCDGTWVLPQLDFLREVKTSNPPLAKMLGSQRHLGIHGEYRTRYERRQNLV